MLFLLRDDLALFEEKRAYWITTPLYNPGTDNLFRLWRSLSLPQRLQRQAMREKVNASDMGVIDGGVQIWPSNELDRGLSACGGRRRGGADMPMWRAESVFVQHPVLE